MLFKQYKTSVNEDDSVNIHDVEIFKLGNHKGFDFSKDWATKAVENFNTEKQGDFLPSVIIGHNEPGQTEEKPAKGFMDNLRVESDTVITDITKIPPTTFESIKNREYPHRSVEVNPQKATFTALALLGGTRPYHKLPIMEFHEDADHMVLEFETPDLKKAIQMDQKYKNVFDIIRKIRDMISNIRWDPEMKEADKNKGTKSVLKQASTILSTESKKFNQEDKTMQFNSEQLAEAKTLTDQQFKDKYGVTPEEMATQYNQFQEDQKAEKLQAFKESITGFVEKLKKDLHVAPKFADKLARFLETQTAESQPVIKFLEDDKEVEKPAVEFFQDVITAVFEEAAKGPESQLFVPTKEMEQVEFADSNLAEDDREKIHNKAVKQANELVAAGKFEDFNTAYNSVIMQLAE